jgi:hypothetical protein
VICVYEQNSVFVFGKIVVFTDKAKPDGSDNEVDVTLLN